MEKEVENSGNIMDKMKDAAESMKKLKENVEQVNSIKNQGKDLLKDLSEAKYGKVSLGISEQISGISLDPSTYIPDLDCTRDVKRKCSFSCYREKSLLGRIDSFTNRSSNFLSTNTPKSLNSLCKEVQQELRRSDQIKTAAKESNNALIPIYQAQIKNLEIQNKKIDKTLSNPDVYKNDPVKYFQLEDIKNKNIMRMGKLVERINKIRSTSEEVSKEDKKAIAEVYNKKLSKDLRNAIIQSKIERNKRFK
ncbi:hypothetical protein [Candidatus Cardinium hertigii]|uniref:hypothetical protein n=1 Tax=Candidatus Cardinium hertigii TaxID=247481 RepID=UPI003D7E87D5